MLGVLYNARSSIQCPVISIQVPEFYTMPGEFCTMPGVLYNTWKIFKSTFCSHLGPIRAIGARFFRRSQYIELIYILGMISKKKSFSLFFAANLTFDLLFFSIKHAALLIQLTPPIHSSSPSSPSSPPLSSSKTIYNIAHFIKPYRDPVHL